MMLHLRTYLSINNVFLFIVYAVVSVVLFFSNENVEAKTNTKNGISIVISHDASQYLSVVKNIRKDLKQNNYEVTDVIYLSGPKKTININLNNKKLVVLIGSKSFDYYVNSGANSPYLTTLITQSAFKFIFNKSKNKNQFIGGIMIDQPPRRFISLSKALVPNLKKAAIVLGPETVKNRNKILSDISKFNLYYELLDILQQDNPVNKLRGAYENNQALVLFPDKKKFNRGLSRWVLTLSYQYKIPVISYSKKYAKAGALASIFSNADQIGKQTARMMIPFLKNPNIKPSKLVEPELFDIYINQSVGSALNITIPSKNELFRKINN